MIPVIHKEHRHSPLDNNLGNRFKIAPYQVYINITYIMIKMMYMRMIFVIIRNVRNRKKVSANNKIGNATVQYPVPPFTVC